MAIVVLSTTARLNDVLAALMCIASLNALVHVDDAHRRARPSAHQLTRAVTAGGEVDPFA